MSKKASAPEIKMQERAFATRNRLLEATFQCLVEKGYAGTTTQEVCRRMGISRGTLLHHFSTREELVIAAVEYVQENAVLNFQNTMAQFAHGRFSLTDIAMALWEQYWTSDTFYARLELAVASRTDPVLNRQVREMNRRWMEKLSSIFKSIFNRELGGAYWLFFLMLNALSLDKIQNDPAWIKKALEDLMALVKLSDRFFVGYSDLSGGASSLPPAPGKNPETIRTDRVSRGKK